MTKRTRQLISLTLAVAALGAIGLAFSGSSSGDKIPVVAPAQANELRSEALQFSAANGEPTPSDAQLVAVSSRRAAVAATMGGAQVLDSDQPVYVIQLQGDFIGYKASVPPGIPKPRGHSLVLIFDAANSELTDWSMSAKLRDLTQLGTPEPLIP